MRPGLGQWGEDDCWIARDNNFRGGGELETRREKIPQPPTEHFTVFNEKNIDDLSELQKWPKRYTFLQRTNTWFQHGLLLRSFSSKTKSNISHRSRFGDGKHEQWEAVTPPGGGGCSIFGMNLASNSWSTAGSLQTPQATGINRWLCRILGLVPKPTQMVSILRSGNEAHCWMSYLSLLLCVFFGGRNP